jgi:hypothetical protein
VPSILLDVVVVTKENMMDTDRERWLSQGRGSLSQSARGTAVALIAHE